MKNKNSPRNTQQHSAYATRRAGLALDNLVAAKTTEERAQAQRWVFAWVALATVPTLWGNLRPALVPSAAS
jgi:hypothetical protein